MNFLYFIRFYFYFVLIPLLYSTDALVTKRAVLCCFEESYIFIYLGVVNKNSNNKPGLLAAFREFISVKLS